MQEVWICIDGSSSALVEELQLISCSRFHAWQSSLLFTAVFILHLIFSWSTFLSWVIFLGDLALMAFMALKAYRDADTLDR